MIPTTRRGGPNREEAETIALEALGFLAGDQERLGRFLADTGIGPDTLMRQASTPATMTAVLDHLLGDESMLLVFAATAGYRPEHIAAAHAVLTAPTGKPGLQP